MFWGVVLKPGASHTLKEGSDLLHVSQACLADAKEGKCQIQVTDNNVTYTIAVLEKDKNEMASLDLFFNTVSPPTFINKGKTEVHLSGYFEMSNDMESEHESLDEEIDSDIEADEDITSAADANAAITGISKKAYIAAEEAEDDEEDDEDMIDDEAEEDDEEEDDEEDEDDDEEEEDDEENEEEDDKEDEEEDDEEEEEEEVAPMKNNKRPAPVAAKEQPAAKAQKADPAAETYAKGIIAFLRTNGGKQSVSAIGGKVQKPAGVPKLKQFCVARKEFKVTGDLVELA